MGSTFSSRYDWWSDGVRRSGQQQKSQQHYQHRNWRWGYARPSPTNARRLQRQLMIFSFASYLLYRNCCMWDGYDKTGDIEINFMQPKRFQSHPHNAQCKSQYNDGRTQKFNLSYCDVDWNRNGEWLNDWHKYSMAMELNSSNEYATPQTHIVDTLAPENGGQKARREPDEWWCIVPPVVEWIYDNNRNCIQMVHPRGNITW